MNTQHTEPSPWLFTSNNTLLSLHQQVHLSYGNMYNTFVYNTCPDTHSYSLKKIHMSVDHTYKRPLQLRLFKGTRELKWLKQRRWLLNRDMHTPLFWVLLCGWDHYLSVTLKHCLCASKCDCEWRTSGRSDTSPHCRFMVVYVSWDSQRDSLIARQRGLALSLICFCFFSCLPPPFSPVTR